MELNHTTARIYLDRETAVIREIFAGLRNDGVLRPAGCIEVSDSGTTTWHQLRFAFRTLCSVICPKAPDVGIECDVVALIMHFNAPETHVKVLRFLEGIDFEDCLDLTALILIARAMNDGHNIRTHEVFRCWKGSGVAIQEELGGSSEYGGEHFSLDLDTGVLMETARDIESSLIAGDSKSAAAVLTKHLRYLLDGIDDLQKRADVTAALAAEVSRLA